MNFGLYLLLNLVVLLFFGIWIRRLIVRRLEPDRILADLENEVERVIHNLNTAGDQNITLIEDRIESLKTLLRHADKQIDEMEMRLREIQASQDIRDDSSLVSGNGSSEHGDAPDGGGKHVEAPSEPTFTIPFGGTDGGGGSGRLDSSELRRDGSGERSVEEYGRVENTTERPEHREQPAEMRPSRARVLELYGQGLSSDLIASKTGVAIGEVELIISLETKRART